MGELVQHLLFPSEAHLSPLLGESHELILDIATSWIFSSSIN